jgi:hypothetical protein
MLFGILGSALLLITLAFFTAVFSSVPAVPAPSATNPDFRIRLTEDFLNRFAEQPADGTTQVDILPANQVRLIVDIPVDVFGVPLPVQLVGLFQIELMPPTISVSLLDTQVSGANLNLSGMFTEDIVSINQDLQAALDEVSELLGIPVGITGLQTSDSAIQLELTEVP